MACSRWSRFFAKNLTIFEIRYTDSTVSVSEYPTMSKGLMSASFVVVFLCGFVAIACADDSDRLKPNEFETEITLTIKNNYLLYLPEDYGKQERWPLLVFLHGAGERGDDLELLKVHGPPKLIAAGKDFPCIVLAPQCAKHTRWYPQALIELIDKIANEYKVDKSRIYLTGLSMGGSGTWALGADYPRVFAAIAPICGRGRPDKAEALVSTPTWVFHGAKDKTVKIEESEKMVEAIKAAGGNPKFTVYPEAEHDSWTETYDNPKFFEWLFGQRKK